MTARNLYAKKRLYKGSKKSHTAFMVPPEAAFTPRFSTVQRVSDLRLQNVSQLNVLRTNSQDCGHEGGRVSNA